MINVRLPWPPTVNTYYRRSGTRMHMSHRGKQFKREALTELMAQKAPKGLDSRLEVRIDAYPPDRRKRDLDNIVKPVLDAMQAHGMFDDSQVDDLRVRRRGKGGYVRVHVSEIE